MKNIVILGSTGSIGKQTLDVLRSKKGHYKVFGLAAKDEVFELKKQINEFKPKTICLANNQAKERLQKIMPRIKIKIQTGEIGLISLATDQVVNTVVIATSGTTALMPTLKAIKAKKRILMANKESLIAANNLINRNLKKHKAEFLPLDSEHSAIFQCLKGENKKDIKNLILTCSGGPLKNYSYKQLNKVKKENVLSHPIWKMGPKITVDSATLMNKGFEVLEASYLFNVPLEKIKVVIHPECVIHSMVEFVDGVIMAQLSSPDMRLPIQYALFHPNRETGFLECLNLTKIKQFSFFEPDIKKFPCLDLARQAGRIGGTMPAVLVFADEIAVKLFLKGRIKFTEIPEIIKNILKKHKPILNPKIEDILKTEEWVKKELEKL